MVSSVTDARMTSQRGNWRTDAQLTLFTCRDYRKPNYRKTILFIDQFGVSDPLPKQVR